MKNHIELKNELSLHYRDWGTGSPILFIPSWGCTVDGWSYQMLPLSESGFRCISYDRRGHGKSSDPGDGYDFDTLSDDLHGVIESLGLENLILVGYSMGCGEIAHYLARHGASRVKGIVFIGTLTPFFPFRSAETPQGVDPKLVEISNNGLAENLPKWIDENIDPFFVPETKPSYKDWVRQMIMSNSHRALMQCFKSNLMANFTADLKKIEVPVLIVHGERDVSQRVEFTAKRTAALIPQSRLIIYPDAPHGLPFTHAKKLNQDLLEFVNTIAVSEH